MFVGVKRQLELWRLRRQTERKLSRLDDWLLADLGIERSHIRDFIASKARGGEMK